MNIIVIPGRSHLGERTRNPAPNSDFWIPGSRQEARPGMTRSYLGTTAVASISTRAAFSTSRTTCTSAIAG
jgi:hypothetical protein